MVAWSSWVCWILKPCGMMIEHSKLFTMRTLTAGSAKQSIKFEIFPCMGYISFFLCYKHNRFTNWADIVVNLHLLKSSMIEPFVVPQRDCFLQISIFQKMVLVLERKGTWVELRALVLFLLVFRANISFFQIQDIQMVGFLKILLEWQTFLQNLTRQLFLIN